MKLLKLLAKTTLLTMSAALVFFITEFAFCYLILQAAEAATGKEDSLSIMTVMSIAMLPANMVTLLVVLWVIKRPHVAEVVRECEEDIDS